MTPRQKRFAWIASGLAALVLVAGLLLYALNSNIVFFYTPTQVSQGEAPSGRAFRIGGLVEPGSLKRDGAADYRRGLGPALAGGASDGMGF